MQEKIGHLLIPPFPDTRRLAATAPYLCNFYYLHPDILAAYNRINLVSCHCNNRYALSKQLLCKVKPSLSVTFITSCFLLVMLLVLAVSASILFGSIEHIGNIVVSLIHNF